MATVDIKQTVFQDSVNINPGDSVCFIQAIKAWDAINDFIDAAAHFIVLFPEGTKEYKPELLSNNDLDKYEFYTKEMRKNLGQYRKLIDIVSAYQPYQYRRTVEIYAEKNGDGQIMYYAGIYFFDSEDNLERYLWFDQIRWTMANSLIKYAMEHDFEFLNAGLKKCRINFGESLLAYVASDDDGSVFNADEIQHIKQSRKSQVKKQSIRANNARNAGTSTGSSAKVSTQTKSSNTTSTSYSSNNYVSGVQYVVTKDVCGATYSKNAMKTFTKYSINDDSQGINYMLATGQLVVLRRNQVVTMIDLGYSLSKIRLANGAIVYTDTENLMKR
jgi:hypothetical protein